MFIYLGVFQIWKVLISDLIPLWSSNFKFLSRNSFLLWKSRIALLHAIRTGRSANKNNQLFPHHILKRLSFCHWITWHFYWTTIDYIRVICSRTVNSMPMIYKSILMPIPYWCYHCNFKIQWVLSFQLESFLTWKTIISLQGIGQVLASPLLPTIIYFL